MGKGDYHLDSISYAGSYLELNKAVCGWSPSIYRPEYSASYRGSIYRSSEYFLAWSPKSPKFKGKSRELYHKYANELKALSEQHEKYHKQLSELLLKWPNLSTEEVGKLAALTVALAEVQ